MLTGVANQLDQDIHRPMPELVSVKNGRAIGPRSRRSKKANVGLRDGNVGLQHFFGHDSTTTAAKATYGGRLHWNDLRCTRLSALEPTLEMWECILSLL
jgi:hypothetical protein